VLFLNGDVRGRPSFPENSPGTGFADSRQVHGWLRSLLEFFRVWLIRTALSEKVKMKPDIAALPMSAG
jgi:hypothetical protein